MADGGHLGDREHFWREHVAGWKSSGLSLVYDGAKALTDTPAVKKRSVNI